MVALLSPITAVPFGFSLLASAFFFSFIEPQIYPQVNLGLTQLMTMFCLILAF